MEQHIYSKITTMAEWQPVKNVHLGHDSGNSLTAPHSVLCGCHTELEAHPSFCLPTLQEAPNR